MAEMITARPGRMWSLQMEWRHGEETPLWTSAGGWHPNVAPRVCDLHAQAQAEMAPGALLIAPAPSGLRQEVVADGVRAGVGFDLTSGLTVCLLATREVSP